MLNIDLDKRPPLERTYWQFQFEHGVVQVYVPKMMSLEEVEDLEAHFKIIAEQYRRRASKS